METENRYKDYRSIYKLKPWIREKDLVISTLCMNRCEGAGKVFENLSKQVNYDHCLKPEHPFNKLSHNPAEWSREYLSKYPQHIDYKLLCDNPSEWACKILKRHRKDEIIWKGLVQNPTEWAGKMIKNTAKSSYFFWDTYYLYSNPSPWVYDVIIKYSLEPVWYILSENPSEWAREMLMKDPQRITFSHLSLNPSEWARELLIKNPQKIDYNYLCLNPAKWAWELLEAKSACNLLDNNKYSIFWTWLCRNPSDWVVEVLEKNKFQINWYWLSQNPHIFEYDYAFIRERFWNTIGEELMQVCFHPRNLGKFSGWGYDSGMESGFESD